MENYKLVITFKGTLYLYHDTFENGIRVDNLTATFQDWQEFFSIVCGPSFTRNPFDGIKNLYIQVINNG